MAFEAASIKERTPPGSGSFVGRRPGGRFAAENASLRELVEFAYQIQGFQLTGNLGAMETARWDVSAKLAGVPAPAPPGAPDDTLLALRALLAERFGLAVHRETRDLSVFALVLARADGRRGPGLVTSNVDCPALIAAILTRGAPPPAGGPPCGLRGRIGSVKATGVPLSELALALSGRVERAVVDQTALGGTWDVTLTYAPDSAPTPAGAVAPGAAPPTAAAEAPSLFTALQEQLGLRLVSTRAPVEVLVVDRVQPPTPD